MDNSLEARGSNLPASTPQKREIESGLKPRAPQPVFLEVPLDVRNRDFTPTYSGLVELLGKLRDRSDALPGMIKPEPEDIHTRYDTASLRIKFAGDQLPSAQHLRETFDIDLYDEDGDFTITKHKGEIRIASIKGRDRIRLSPTLSQANEIARYPAPITPIAESASGEHVLLHPAGLRGHPVVICGNQPFVETVISAQLQAMGNDPNVESIVFVNSPFVDFDSSPLGKVSNRIQYVDPRVASVSTNSRNPSILAPISMETNTVVPGSPESVSSAQKGKRRPVVYSLLGTGEVANPNIIKSLAAQFELWILTRDIAQTDHLQEIVGIFDAPNNRIETNPVNNKALRQFDLMKAPDVPNRVTGLIQTPRSELIAGAIVRPDEITPETANSEMNLLPGRGINLLGTNSDPGPFMKKARALFSRR